MWNTRLLEKVMESRLKKEFGSTRGQEVFAGYLSARKALVEDILPEIKAVMPHHSDHGSRHIADVLDKAHALLDGENRKGNEASLSAAELYSLGLAILFHDSGNLFGREGHQNNIAKIYDFCRGGKPENNQEKMIILQMVAAHTGKARDGSFDTLRDLSADSNLFDKLVRLREIAAILRFADELAEGPQRTSRFMQELHRYPAESQIYHSYASCVKIFADRGNNRVALTFHLETTQDDIRNGLEDLLPLLEFVYKRILKLDQERRYATFYSSLLAPFKRTTVQLNFFVSGNLVNLDLAPLEISDKIVPGDQQKALADYDSNYSLEAVVQRLQAYIDEES